MLSDSFEVELMWLGLPATSSIDLERGNIMNSVNSIVQVGSNFE